MKGKVDVLLGLQWGDEGKGKIVDVLTPQYDIVARFQGGPNAGHTLEFDGKKHVLHQIPSGIFRTQVVNIIGNGVVLEPVIFQKEINSISENFDLNIAVLVDRLLLSNKAKLILPTHRLIDKAKELLRGKNKIGSTCKGIGPTYQDDKARLGLRVGDIFDPCFYQRFEKLERDHLALIDAMNFDEFDRSIDSINYADYRGKWLDSIEFLKTFQIIPTEYYINEMLDEGKSVLAEGAQGSLLDIEFGTYPMVTSSNVTSGGVCVGLGVSPNRIDKIYGLFKAYATRVGNGQFPTELYHQGNSYFQDSYGKLMAECGNEYGSTTGRPRRCGWIDLPALNYACMLNGVTNLIMTKADVLSSVNGFKYLRVANRYQMKTGYLKYEFYSDKLDKILYPVYKQFESWPDIYGIDSIDQIPAQLSNYIDFIEKYLKIPICIVSTGPDRSHMVLKGLI